MNEVERVGSVNTPIDQCLRQLSESLILIRSAMFGATFNLVTHVGLLKFLEH